MNIYSALSSSDEPSSIIGSFIYFLGITGRESFLVRIYIFLSAKWILTSGLFVGLRVW